MDTIYNGMVGRYLAGRALLADADVYWQDLAEGRSARSGISASSPPRGAESAMCYCVHASHAVRNFPVSFSLHVDCCRAAHSWVYRIVPIHGVGSPHIITHYSFIIASSLRPVSAAVVILWLHAGWVVSRRGPRKVVGIYAFLDLVLSEKVFLEFGNERRDEGWRR